MRSEQKWVKKNEEEQQVGAEFHAHPVKSAKQPWHDLRDTDEDDAAVPPAGHPLS